jgi:hypothetical protein
VNLWSKNILEEGYLLVPRARSPPRRALMAWDHLPGALASLFCYKMGFDLEKIRRYFWDEASPPRGGNLTRGLFALRQRDSIRETSLREGEIEAIIITNASSFMGGPIFIHIFTSTISSQTLVHLLYSIFVSKPQIGTCGLLVVLITSCS